MADFKEELAEQLIQMDYDLPLNEQKVVMPGMHGVRIFMTYKNEAEDTKCAKCIKVNSYGDYIYKVNPACK